jgi:NADPH:quinone reductase-like Zn-dependent oxidoreductase
MKEVKMKQIKKVIIQAFGDESQLSIVADTIQDPAPGEVQIKVEYSPVSGADINMRKGNYPFQKMAPLTPGYSIIGRVEKNGAASTQFKAGELVVCLTKYDGQAEFVNLPERFLVSASESVDPKQAVALVLDWVTAYQMLNRVAQVKRGDRVFIHGLSGAVGRGLLALAQLKGAQIFGTASPRNHAELQKLGATAFSYADKKWISVMKQMGGVDLVFDPLGFQSFDESYSILNAGGRLVAYGMNLRSLSSSYPRHFLLEYFRILGKNLKFWTQKSTRFYGLDRSSKYYLADLKTLLQLLESKQIAVPIKATYLLAEIRQAHADWGKSEGMGTMIIAI